MKIVVNETSFNSLIQNLINEVSDKRYDTFIKHVTSILNDVLEEAKFYLKKLGLNVSYKQDYNFSRKRWIASYVNGSVETGTIQFGLNIPYLYKLMSDNRISNNFTEIEAQVYVSIFHEIGHGLFAYLRTCYYKNEKLKEYVNNNKMSRFLFCSPAKEEKIVETFGESFLDMVTGVYPEESDLRVFVKKILPLL